MFDPNAPGSRHRTTSNNNNNNTNNQVVNTNNASPSMANTETGAPSVDTTKLSNEDTKDPYLVDVDVDVDGVMMDGLDQVEYMNRASGSVSNNRFYGEGNENGLLIDEDENEQEPISRTLEALALEGLTEF